MDGHLYVPYLIENGGKVILNWNRLDNDWNSSNPTLRFATTFISKDWHFAPVFSFINKFNLEQVDGRKKYPQNLAFLSSIPYSAQTLNKLYADN